MGAPHQSLSRIGRIGRSDRITWSCCGAAGSVTARKESDAEATSKLLYVDDHLAFRRLVIRLFLADHQTTTAGSLADARALLEHTHFDVVLLDYDLPDGKGLELLPDIRRFQSGCRIIAVSAQPENNAILVAAGADAQLPKADFCRIGELLIRAD